MKIYWKGEVVIDKFQNSRQFDFIVTKENKYIHTHA